MNSKHQPVMLSRISVKWKSLILCCSFYHTEYSESCLVLNSPTTAKENRHRRIS
jgi:hypothetical protein